MSIVLCPHCGTLNRIGSNFCNACGVDLRGDEPRPKDSPTGEPSSTQSTSPKPRPPKPTPEEPSSAQSQSPENRAETRRKADADSPAAPESAPDFDRDEVYFDEVYFDDDGDGDLDDGDLGDSDLGDDDDVGGDADEDVHAGRAEPATRPGDAPVGGPEDVRPESPRAQTTRREDADSLFDSQPWLHYGFEDDPDDDPDADPDADGYPQGMEEDETGAHRPGTHRSGGQGRTGEWDGAWGARLVPGIQGLLDPIRISPRLSETRRPPGSMGARGDGSATLQDAEAIRRFRRVLAQDPRLPSGIAVGVSIPLGPRMAIPWLFLLIAVVVGVPLLLGLRGGQNLPPEWPGVLEAHAQIEGLRPDSVILVYWAYDPATAGELDLAARPVLRHLLDGRARVVGVSPLPAGPATARRVVEEIHTSRAESGLFAGATHNPWPVQVGFLPGGAAALPLVATRPAVAIGPGLDGATAQALDERPAALAVVFAAQSEDVQQWLEQVHTRNRVPVVAVVSAGADPVLRPYLDSGQLRGLVSGFDGAFHYQARLDPQASRSDGLAIRAHLAGQNWGHLAIFAVLILGNLAAILGRSGRE